MQQAHYLTVFGVFMRVTRAANIHFYTELVLIFLSDPTAPDYGTTRVSVPSSPETISVLSPETIPTVTVV